MKFFDFKGYLFTWGGLLGQKFSWIYFRNCPKFIILRWFNFTFEGSPKDLMWIKFRGSKRFCKQYLT